jgi:hypothetical protein
VFKKRWPLRVSACGKRTKRSEREKSSTDPAADKEGEEAEEAEGEARPDKKRRRDEDEDRKGKRPKGPTASDAALRRLKHKVRARPECVLSCSPGCVGDGCGHCVLGITAITSLDVVVVVGDDEEQGADRAQAEEDTEGPTWQASRRCGEACNEGSTDAKMILALSCRGFFLQLNKADCSDYTTFRYHRRARFGTLSQPNSSSRVDGERLLLAVITGREHGG